VLGLGPIGDMATRIALHQGRRVIAVDLVDERLQRATARGAEVLDLRDHDDDLGDAIRSMTDGRGPDSVIDAVGMEAHGSPAASFIQRAAGLLPDSLQEKVMDAAGIDRLRALHTAVDVVRRGGTLSVIGVYGGAADPMPMKVLFDKQIQVRMGQANVMRWVDDLLPLLVDDDPLGVDDFATHRLLLEQAPEAYADFQAKRDGTVKVLLRP
jgi:threonine dehydrogenase-like Zn-dependent dehydrogenase